MPDALSLHSILFFLDVIVGQFSFEYFCLGLYIKHQYDTLGQEPCWFVWMIEVDGNELIYFQRGLLPIIVVHTKKPRQIGVGVNELIVL